MFHHGQSPKVKMGVRDHDLMTYFKFLMGVFVFLLQTLRCSALECYVDNRLLNMALSKTTYASSTSSSRTTDGDRGEYDSTCMNTAVQENPWLIVDLHETVSVSTVVLTAFTAYQATTQYQILVGDTFDAATFNPLTSGYEPCISRPVSMHQFEVLHVQCERTLVGRYILIFKQQTSNLRICEVEVYADQEFQPEKWTCIRPELQGPTGLLNLGRGRGENTYQKSTGWGGYAWKAVDGNDDPYYGDSNSCIHHARHGSAWWLIDLGKDAVITGVAVTNRDDGSRGQYLKNFKILVGNLGAPSTVFDESNYQEVVHMCVAQSAGRKYYKVEPTIQGNHVAFTMNGWLHLCEIEIYSDNLNDVSFPAWTKLHNLTLLHQALLYDGDDNTCLMLGPKYPSSQVNPFNIVIPWDPTARTGLAEHTANYYCKQDFNVNVTHTADVKLMVIVKGEVVEDVVHGSWTIKGKACTLIGATEHLNMVRTRYACYCEDKCEVIVQARSSSGSNVYNSRVCTINVYD